MVQLFFDLLPDEVLIESRRGRTSSLGVGVFSIGGVSHCFAVRAGETGKNPARQRRITEQNSLGTCLEALQSQSLLADEQSWPSPS